MDRSRTASGRGLRPRDFVETDDGLLGAVTSVVHADGPVVTLRYERTAAGLRKLDAAQASALAAARRPHWRVRSPLLDLDVLLVPHAEIARVHRPEARLAALRSGEARRRLERRAARAAGALVARGVPAERLGVTGSLLVGSGRDGSDIDLVVYGRAAFARARACLAALLADGTWRELAADDWRAAWERRGAPGSLAAYVAHERRKHTKAMVEGVRLDLSLLQDDGEAPPERPPYRKLGRRRVEAVVTDDRGAFDLPARWRVDDPAVPEVVSFTATYAGQAIAGERIAADGWLEEDADGRRRLLVGTSREAPGEGIRVLDGPVAHGD